jgi:hypothetical protein
MDANAHHLTPAGKVVFGVVPLVLGGVYLYLLWCVVNGRIAVRSMRGSRTRWVHRRESPKEFWLHWCWSLGGLTLISIVLVGALVRLYLVMTSG